MTPTPPSPFAGSNSPVTLVEYEQFQDAIAASFGGTKVEKPDEYRKRSAEMHLDKLTMPICSRCC